MRHGVPWCASLLAVLLGLACDGRDTDSDPHTDLPTSCDGLVGGGCVHRVGDVDTFRALAVPFQGGFVTKYLAPAREDARLEALVMDAHVYRLHYDLLATGFEDRFPGLSQAEYLGLILDPSAREFWAGTLTLQVDEDGPWVGFTVLEDGGVPASSPGREDVEAIWRMFSSDAGLPRLSYVPETERQRLAARDWADVPFPIRGVEPVSYEVYTEAVAFGRARLLDPAAFEQATRAGSYGWQDVLVLDEAPVDVERVIAGSVTGTRQGILSHLNVRAAGRGSPNCYVPDPRAAFAGLDGELVRVSCGPDALAVRTATQAEAEAWWATFRPDPIVVPEADRSWTAMEGLLEVPVATPADRADALARYGAKGSNLAILYRHVPAELQLKGFLVPMHFGDAFLRETTWTVDLGAGPAEHSFADTVAAWANDPAFTSDAALRRTRLAELRAAIRAREDAVDDALIDALTGRIRATWGGDDTMVRFRSSSNAEDALGFTGAGLYDSTSACLADELDGDEEGPSHCDRDKSRERTLRAALLEVWASSFNAAAWDERDWFGIDHTAVSMGILVNTRAKDEQANVVAFTGNPTGSDPRILINAQVGDLDVVTSIPGVYPEMTWADVSGDDITLERIRGSSQLPPGEWVLDEDQSADVARALDAVERVYPVDHEIPEGATLLFDTEWKVLADGRLIIKQIRPFLR